MLAYVYILRCSDDTYYTGWTKDIDNRLKVHNRGRASKYTRVRLPVKLIYFEYYESESEAKKREAAIKKLSRKEKEKLIKSDENKRRNSNEQRNYAGKESMGGNRCQSKP